MYHVGVFVENCRGILMSFDDKYILIVIREKAITIVSNYEENNKYG